MGIIDAIFWLLALAIVGITILGSIYFIVNRDKEDK